MLLTRKKGILAAMLVALLCVSFSLFGVCGLALRAADGEAEALTVVSRYEQNDFAGGNQAVLYDSGGNLRIALKFDKALSTGAVADIFNVAYTSGAENFDADLKDSVWNKIKFNGKSLGAIAEAGAGNILATIGMTVNGGSAVVGDYTTIGISIYRATAFNNGYADIYENQYADIAGVDKYQLDADKNKIEVLEGFKSGLTNVEVKQSIPLRISSGIILEEAPEYNNETLTINRIDMYRSPGGSTSLQIIFGENLYALKTNRNDVLQPIKNAAMYADDANLYTASTFRHAVGQLIKIDGVSLLEIMSAKEGGSLLPTLANLLVNIGGVSLIITGGESNQFHTTDVFNAEENHTVTVESGFVTPDGSRLLKTVTAEYTANSFANVAGQYDHLTLSIGALPEYKVSAKPSDKSLGTVGIVGVAGNADPATGAVEATLAHDTNVVVSAAPESGYVVSGWLRDHLPIPEADGNLLTLVIKEDVLIEAVFEAGEAPPTEPPTETTIITGYDKNKFSQMTAAHYTASDNVRIYVEFEHDLAMGATGNILADGYSGDPALKQSVLDKIEVNGSTLSAYAAAVHGGVEAYVGRTAAGYLATVNFKMLELVFVRTVFAAAGAAFPIIEDYMPGNAVKKYMFKSDLNKITVSEGFSTLMTNIAVADDTDLKIAAGILMPDSNPVTGNTLEVVGVRIVDGNIWIDFNEHLYTVASVNNLANEMWVIGASAQNGSVNYAHGSAAQAAAFAASTFKYSVDRLVKIDGLSINEHLRSAKFGEAAMTDSNLTVTAHVRNGNSLVVTASNPENKLLLFDPSTNHTLSVEAGFTSGFGNQLADTFRYNYRNVPPIVEDDYTLADSDWQTTKILSVSGIRAQSDYHPSPAAYDNRYFTVRFDRAVTVDILTNVNYGTGMVGAGSSDLRKLYGTANGVFDAILDNFIFNGKTMREINAGEVEAGIAAAARTTMHMYWSGDAAVMAVLFAKDSPYIPTDLNGEYTLSILAGFKSFTGTRTVQDYHFVHKNGEFTTAIATRASLQQEIDAFEMPTEITVENYMALHAGINRLILKYDALAGFDKQLIADYDKVLDAKARVTAFIEGMPTGGGDSGCSSTLPVHAGGIGFVWALAAIACILTSKSKKRNGEKK